LPEARVLELPSNVGFGEGCNRGIAATTGTWIGTLNNDVRVQPGWFDAMCAEIRSADSCTGMFQSRMMSADLISSVDSAGILVCADGDIRDRGRGLPAEQVAAGTEIFCASAGAAVFRRSMLEGIATPHGIFDRDFFMYFEDVDLGWRSRLAGWNAYYVPDAEVLHYAHGSAEAHGNNFVKAQCARNRIRTLLSNGSPVLLVRWLPRIARDLLWLVWHEGWTGAVDFGRSVRGGLESRHALPQVLRRERRRIEEQWILKE
jgi:GT2 family glycosyltransferase